MSRCGETLTVRNPYNESIVTSEVQVAGSEDINVAVAAARTAWTTGPWSRFTGSQRAACMLKFADLVEKNMESLAYLETLAVGKPMSAILTVDIPNMIGCYRC
jgi:aldehyde dehydrogenase (NAD+)